MIKTIDVVSGETTGLYQYLSAAITPRPIAFVSTVDQNGNKNLSPFSFFNVFSINPPILIFSQTNSDLINGNWDIIALEYNTQIDLEISQQDISGEASDAGTCSFNSTDYAYIMNLNLCL